MTDKEFYMKHLSQIGDLQGEYLDLCPIRSYLDGNFTAHQLRMIAYSMDRMRKDPEKPDDIEINQGWYK